MVDSVTVRFGGLSVLDEVSLRASVGEIVGVIGPNGAGKTTLFNVICGFVRPESGQVTWRGRRLHNHRPHDLASMGIARTLQGVGLFGGCTVLENVLVGTAPVAGAGLGSAVLGLWRSSRDEKRQTERAMGALALLHVDEFADRLPSALPYPIQKRVALARALVAEPTLVLMDEPASGLSAADIAELADLLRNLKAERGVLVVEHNMDLVMATCDRIVVLDFGKVISAGSPAEVQADPAVTTAYLGEVIEVGDSAGSPGA
ncbi:MAG TPA: ABC transporter ATP-binding protein [Acidimicrobiales bacterium]|nr:ABC transporter ATP-binding protein [Acidimicrobiales bacterium]